MTPVESDIGGDAVSTLHQFLNFALDPAVAHVMIPSLRQIPMLSSNENHATAVLQLVDRDVDDRGCCLAFAAAEFNAICDWFSKIQAPADGAGGSAMG